MRCLYFSSHQKSPLDQLYPQPNQQAVSSLPLGEIPHHVHTRGRHPQQEEGDLQPFHASWQADLGQEEEEEENLVLVPLKQLLTRPSVDGERVVRVNFHFLHCALRILTILAHSVCLTSGNTKAVLAINNVESCLAFFYWAYINRPSESIDHWVQWFKWSWWHCPPPFFDLRSSLEVAWMLSGAYSTSFRILISLSSFDHLS